MHETNNVVLCYVNEDFISHSANSALDLQHPFLKVRPISMATRPTKMKAKKCSGED